MTNEKLDKRDRFLLKEGKRVYDPKEISVGNVIGTVEPSGEDIRLRYIKSISLEPSFLKLDYFSYISFMGPFFGFRVNDNCERIGFSYLSLDPQNSNNSTWCPQLVDTSLPPNRQHSQIEWIESNDEDICPLGAH